MVIVIVEEREKLIHSAPHEYKITKTAFLCLDWETENLLRNRIKLEKPWASISSTEIKSLEACTNE